VTFTYGFDKIKPMPISPTYTKTIIIPNSAIDENGHVNNVTYVQWMQDIAVEHYASIGGIAAQGPDSTWVIRKHSIEYFLPAFEGEEIEDPHMGGESPQSAVIADV
jgi:acyl-CoA thioesterase FadM